jgi:hypothetical protein
MSDTWSFVPHFFNSVASCGRVYIFKRASGDHDEKLNLVTWLLDYCKIPYKIAKEEDVYIVHCESWSQKHERIWKEPFIKAADILVRLCNPDPYVVVEKNEVYPYIKELKSLLGEYLQGIKPSFAIEETHHLFIVEILS